MKKINMYFTEKLIEEMDKFCGEDTEFENRSVLIRTAVKMLLQTLEKKDKNENDETQLEN